MWFFCAFNLFLTWWRYREQLWIHTLLLVLNWVPLLRSVSGPEKDSSEPDGPCLTGKFMTHHHDIITAGRHRRLPRQRLNYCRNGWKSLWSPHGTHQGLWYHPIQNWTRLVSGKTARFLCNFINIWFQGRTQSEHLSGVWGAVTVFVKDLNISLELKSVRDGPTALRLCQH